MVAAMCAGGSACQTMAEGDLTTITDRAELSTTAANTIADDMVSSFADVIGPGSATVVLKSDRSPFSAAVVSSLKRRGYALAMTGQKADGGKVVQLGYEIDDFEGSVLARLSTPTVDLGRAYARTATGAAPSSPLSIIRHN
jgi:type IV secretion system protein TrbH